MTPEEIAEDVYQCWKAGAAMAHLHMRDDDGNGTMDKAKFRKTMELLRTSHPDCDIIINMTTSGAASFPTEECRYEHIVELHPEMASYDCGSMNWLNSGLFLNPPAFLEKLGGIMQAHHIKPERQFPVAIQPEVSVCRRQNYSGIYGILPDLDLYRLLCRPHPHQDHPVDLCMQWFNGMWTQLAFSMQMSLMVIVCAATAKSKYVTRAVNKLATYLRSPAVAMCVLMVWGYIASFINWAFCTMSCTVFAIAISKRIKGVHFPLMIVAGYCTSCLGQTLSPTCAVYGLLATEGNYMQEYFGRTLSQAETVYIIPALAMTGSKLKDVWGFMAFMCVFWIVFTVAGLLLFPMIF